MRPLLIEGNKRGADLEAHFTEVKVIVFDNCRPWGEFNAVGGEIENGALGLIICHRGDDCLRATLWQRPQRAVCRPHGFGHHPCMKDWIEHFRSAADGLPVSHIWRGHGSALFIELGQLKPTTRRDGSPGEAEGEIGLMIEWSWRIEDERSIVCGSWSDEDLWKASFARLIGQRVTDVTAFGRLSEILLSFSSGFHIASFMTAEGNPAWALFDRRGPTALSVRCHLGAVTSDE